MTRTRKSRVKAKERPIKQRKSLVHNSNLEVQKKLTANPLKKYSESKLLRSAHERAAKQAANAPSSKEFGGEVRC